MEVNYVCQFLVLFCVQLQRKRPVPRGGYCSQQDATGRWGRQACGTPYAATMRRSNVIHCYSVPGGTGGLPAGG